MRNLFRLLCACALGLMPVVGCGESQCAAACPEFTLVGHVVVELDPRVRSTYDVALVLDGTSGAFTCEGGLRNQTGIGQTVLECWDSGFWIGATPGSVEISVTAQDGSWTGSVKESPTYERRTVCGTLCPPRAVVTIPGSVLTDCAGFEDGTQCMSGELGGICLDGVCAVSADCSGLENGTPCLLEDWGTVLPGRCSGGRCVAECQVLEEGTPCLQSIRGELGVCEGGVCLVQNQ